MGSTGRPHCTQCAVTDENQLVEMDLGYGLGQLPVVVGALLLSRGRQSTDTLIPVAFICTKNFPTVVDQYYSTSSKCRVGVDP